MCPRAAVSKLSCLSWTKDGKDHFQLSVECCRETCLSPFSPHSGPWPQPCWAPCSPALLSWPLPHSGFPSRVFGVLLLSLPSDFCWWGGPCPMQDPWLCFPQVWGHLATCFLLAGPFGMDGERLYYKHADQLAVNTCPVSCPAENWLPRGPGSPVTQPG